MAFTIKKIPLSTYTLNLHRNIFEKNNEWILNTPPYVFQCTSVPTDLYVTFHNVLQYA